MIEEQGDKNREKGKGRWNEVGEDDLFLLFLTTRLLKVVSEALKKKNI